jgi:REP element-mobilizing transposase RayT
MKINYFNADHTHALVDLPTNRTIEQVVQLLKGGVRLTGLMTIV